MAHLTLSHHRETFPHHETHWFNKIIRQEKSLLQRWDSKPRVDSQEFYSRRPDQFVLAQETSAHISSKFFRV